MTRANEEHLGKPQQRDTIKLTVPPIPSAADRSAALAQQARELGQEAVKEFLTSLAALTKDATSLAALETLPPGVRENLKQLATAMVDRAQGIVSISERRR